MQKKICAIIAEYNPFHNGHLYHLKRCGEDGDFGKIVIMSGDFVQRGEPALLDKWSRAEIALRCGADVVVELPAVYALQSAEWFAFGGVALADALGADRLCFGAGIDDENALRQLGHMWAEEPPELKQAIRDGLKSGRSHPRARAEAMKTQSGGADVLDEPNSVLGAMYLLWMERLKSDMEAKIVKRTGPGENDGEGTDSYASATAIRRDLLSGGEHWRDWMTREATGVMEREWGHIVHQEHFDQLALYALRKADSLPQEDESLANRMAEYARTSVSLTEFYTNVKCKRYTMANIKRTAMAALIGMTAEDVAMARRERPLYARVLGFRKESEGLMAALGRNCTVPFVTRTARFAPEGAMARAWELDIAATDVYALASPDQSRRKAGRDFTEKMLIV